MEAVNKHAQQPAEPAVYALQPDLFVERVMGAVRSEQRPLHRWWPFRKTSSEPAPRPRRRARREPAG